MKIKFVIGNPAKFIASEWQEIKKMPKSEPTPDEDTYVLFKALELNKSLEKELILARRNLRLPDDGVTWEQYKKRKDPTSDASKKEIEDILYFIRNHVNEIHRIKRKLLLHPQVEEQLENLILGCFVETLFRGVGFGCNGTNVNDYESIDDFDKNVEVDMVLIDITKKISKNELLRFIDSQWEDISNLMNYLPKTKHFYISPRDMRILNLRDNEKLRYSEIADLIIKEYSIDNMKGSINEDSIKTSYKRAKNKVEELAKVMRGNTSLR